MSWKLYKQQRNSGDTDYSKKHLSEDDPYLTNRVFGVPEKRSQRGHVQRPVTNTANVSRGGKQKAMQVLEINKPACFREVILYCMFPTSYQAVFFLSWKSNKHVKKPRSERKFWASFVGKPKRNAFASSEKTLFQRVREREKARKVVAWQGFQLNLGRVSRK